MIASPRLPHGVDIEAIGTLDHFERRAHCWDEAVTAVPGSPVHLRHSWLRRWWIAARDGSSPRFQIARDGSGVLGVAPWIRDAKPFGPFAIPGVRLAGGRIFSRAQVLIVRREREAFAAMLADLDRLRPWYVDPGKVDPSSPLGRLLGGGDPELAPVQRRRYALPRISVREGWDKYLASRTRDFRKKLRRRQASPRDCAVRAFPDGYSDLRELLEAIAAISRASWANREGTALVSSPREWEFWKGIITDADAEQSLRAICLFDGDRPVSFIFGVVHQRVLFALKTAYCEDAKPSGAGRAVIAALVRAASEDPRIDSIDLDCVTTHGDYKLDWATEVEELQTWYVFGRSAGRRAAAYAYAIRNRLHAARHRDQLTLRKARE